MTDLTQEQQSALAVARHLAENGVPLFVAKADKSGKAEFRLPKNWQKTKPNQAVVDRWRPGDALCLVTGVVVDAVDVDPRNGGDLQALGDLMPTSYGRQTTPSGGTHDLIECLGVRKGTIPPGIDVQAGDPDGGGRGFIYIGPTVRVSKATGEPTSYVWVEQPDVTTLSLFGGDGSGDRLREALEARREPEYDGPDYDGPGYAKLPAEEQRRADEHVVATANHWRALFAEAVKWPDGTVDAKGRGWERQTTNWAWACARMAATPWTPLDADDAKALFDEVLPSEMANNKECRGKWYKGIVADAASRPIEPPPWDMSDFVAVPEPETPKVRRVGSAGLSLGRSDLAYPPPRSATEVARKILNKELRVPGRKGDYTLTRWRGAWMVWRKSHWEEVSEEDVFSNALLHLEHAFYVVVENGVTRTPSWNPAKANVNNLLASIGGLSKTSDAIDSPAWLWGGGKSKGAVISCQNGLLDVATRELFEHTPAFFNTVAVPYDYDPDAPEPLRWLEFLESLWPGDVDAHRLLQQWFGYVLSGRTELHKMLALIGPKRSGKGTIARTLTALLGAGNVGGPSLASLGTNFGLAPLLGKSLAIVGDARLGTGDSAKTALANILGITGEDSVQADRKHRSPFVGRIPVRFMLLSNELPSFFDTSGAIASRFLLLPMRKSFINEEDAHLGKDLLEELPGIFNWALDGLDDLDRRGRFTEPASSGDLRKDFESLVSPISRWITERCETSPMHWTSTESLYDAWAAWCMPNGHTVGSQDLFVKNFRAAFPEARSSRRGPRGQQVWGYAGVRLLAHSEVPDTFDDLLANVNEEATSKKEN